MIRSILRFVLAGLCEIGGGSGFATTEAEQAQPRLMMPVPPVRLVHRFTEHANEDACEDIPIANEQSVSLKGPMGEERRSIVQDDEIEIRRSACHLPAVNLETFFFGEGLVQIDALDNYSIEYYLNPGDGLHETHPLPTTRPPRQSTRRPKTN